MVTIERGKWRAAIKDGVLRWASIECPGCGTGYSVGLQGQHQIANDGTVSPSVVCTTPPCTFHDFVKLEDWAGILKG